MSRVSILGVPFDDLTAKTAAQTLHDMLGGGTFHHVATPNNEMLVAARRNDAFRAVLQRTAMNIADSTGVVWASRHLGMPLPERVTGVDTVTALCAHLGPEHPVFLLGAAEGVAAKAAAVMQERNPRLRVAGTASGSPRDEDAPDLIRQIVDAGTHLLLVAYGAPAQELWIDRHRDALSGVRVAMGVGGTFDFLAGVRKRAPEAMRRVGLEWLWRLVQEPRRIGRIWRAVVVFPWLVLTRR